MTALALPDPQSVTLARVPELIARVQEVRAEVEQTQDGEAALELRRRLEAVEKYLADREASDALAAEARRTEALIGRLAGPAPGQGARTDLFDLKKFDLNPRELADFRALAEHKEEVEELIASGVVKRATLLREINKGGKEPEWDLCHVCGHKIRIDKPRRKLKFPDTQLVTLRENGHLEFAEPLAEKLARASEEEEEEG